MAEYQIDNDASIVVFDLSTPHSWICSDDDGNYWTIFHNTSNYVEIHKSEDDGATWSHKKTLTESDFSSGMSFPMSSIQIVNLKGQDKVYITLIKNDDIWGWLINTSTDIGQKDLDNESLSIATACKIEVRWDSFNSKLKIGYGRTDDEIVYLKTINLSGGFSDESTGSVHHGGNRGYSYCIDSSGNIFYNGMAISAGSYNLVKKFGTGTYKTLGIGNQEYDFTNLVCDHNNKIIVGCVYSNYLHIFRITNDLSTIEINNANYNLGFTPSSCFVTVDGSNNIYFVYTNPSDDEAYSIKYDVDSSSWDSPLKISSDANGILVTPELRPSIDSDKILVTYQSNS